MLLKFHYRLVWLLLGNNNAFKVRTFSSPVTFNADHPATSLFVNLFTYLGPGEKKDDESCLVSQVNSFDFESLNRNFPQDDSPGRRQAGLQGPPHGYLRSASPLQAGLVLPRHNQTDSTLSRGH